MIREVYLKNWRSHGEKNGSYGSVIEFEEGLNVIYGVNGSGKSSVAEAIAYALFGEVSSFKRVLRSGKDEGSVKVVFEADGMYEVVRTFSSKGTLYSELLKIENGKKKPVVLQKSTEVTKKVEEILGISKDLFFRAVYGAQNRILELFEKRGLSRAEIFDQILGLEELNEVRERLVRIRNNITRYLKGVSLGELLRKKKEYEEVVASLQGEIIEKEALLKKKEEELRQAEGELSFIEREVTSLEERKRTYDEYLRRKASLSARKKEIEGGIVYPDADEGVISLLEEVERGLDDAIHLEREIERLKATVRKIERDLESIVVSEGGEDLDLLLKRKERLEERKKDLDKKRKELLTKKEEILREVSSLQEKLRRVEEAKARLDEVRRKKAVILERIEREAEDAESRLEKVVELLSYHRGELIISSSVEAVLRKTSTCPVCGSLLTPERVEEILREQSKKQKTVKEKIRELEEERKRLEGIVSELRELRGKLSQLEDLELKLSSEIKTEPELRKRLEELERKFSEVENELDSIEKELNRVEIELKNIEELIRRESIRKEKLSLKKRLEEELSSARDALRGAEEKLLSLLSPYGVASVEELRKKAEVLREKKRSYELKRRLEEVEKDLLQVESRLKELEPYLAELETKKKLLEEARKKHTDLKLFVEKEAAVLKERKERYELAVRELESVQREIEKIEKLRGVLGKLDRLLSAWNETLKIVRSLRIEAINRALKLVWKEVYLSQYGDYTDIDFRVEETRGGYTYSLLLKTRTGAKEVWRSVEELSGGERTLALIALRLAVSYLLSGKTGFIIMDEPTHNLDENLTRKLAFFLREATEDGLFKQIIVITHDPVFSEAADVVYRFEREKTGDDPTVVMREK